jgi:hypothetical protein
MIWVVTVSVGHHSAVCAAQMVLMTRYRTLTSCTHSASLRDPVMAARVNQHPPMHHPLVPIVRASPMVLDMWSSHTVKLDEENPTYAGFGSA